MAAAGSGGRGEATFPRPLLDRFLRDEDGRHLSASMDAEEHLAVICRDAEELLNTRAGVDVEDGAPSVTGYGLPDFAQLSPDSPEDRWRMSAAIKDALRHFEPRLKNIRVEPDGGDSGALLVSADVKRTHNEQRLFFRVVSGGTDRPPRGRPPLREEPS